jgi:5-methylcytosine-specific restriction endonuclease McrA
MISLYIECIKSYESKIKSKPPYTCICLTCGKSFIAQRRTRQYCSRWHQKTAINTRRVKQYRQPISKFFKKEIIDIYLRRPIGFDVDHIIPINHPDFCGLHVPWNLQYLTSEANRRKSNRVY